MNFTHDKTQSPKRFFGIGVVLVLHALVAYILLNHMGRNIFKPAEPPVEMKILQEIKPPPPPPPKPKIEPPKPKVEPPKPVEPPKIVEKVLKTPEPKKAPTPKPVEQPEPKPTPQPTPKPTPSPSPVPAPTPEPKVEPQPEPKPEPKPAVKAEPPAPKGETHGVADGEAGCAKPDYPRDAQMNEEQGTVRISVYVDTDGSVIDSKVKKSSGSRTLDKAASKAWSQCTFKPATKDGVPIKSWYDIEYTFSL